MTNIDLIQCITLHTLAILAFASFLVLLITSAIFSLGAEIKTTFTGNYLEL